MILTRTNKCRLPALEIIIIIPCTSTTHQKSQFCASQRGRRAEERGGREGHKKREQSLFIIQTSSGLPKPEEMKPQRGGHSSVSVTGMAPPSQTHHCVLCPASCAGRTEMPWLLLTYHSWQNQHKEVRKTLRNIKYENMKINSSCHLLMEILKARFLPQFKDFKDRTGIVTRHRKNRKYFTTALS